MLRGALGLVVVIAATLFGQNGKLNVAVNDLAPQSVDRGEAAIVSDRLRSEMISTGVFRVMERAQMESILKEQGFQKSGACDDASCIVEVGQLLGVERMIAGSLGRVAGLYTLNLRVINVATGEILYTVNEDCECSVKDVLAGATARAAKKLALGAGGEVARAAMAGKVGDLYIESDQAGASVEIDGSAVPGETPLTIQGFAAGDHRVVVRKGSFYGSQNITLSPNDLLKVRVAMKQGVGTLKVFSEPSQAEVLVDGRQAGVTPIKVDGLIAGEHEVVLRRDRYLPARRTVVIGADETNTLTATLRPSAEIRLSCDVKEAAILVNGETAGRGEVQLTVGAGVVVVQIEAPEYEVFRQELELTHGEKRIVVAKLIPRYGTLTLTSRPAGAAIKLDGVATGLASPHEFTSVTPGEHTIRLDMDDHEPWEQACIVVAGRGTAVDAVMVSRLGEVSVTSAPEGASVELDGSVTATPTPARIGALMPGNHTVRVTRTGYESQSMTVAVEKNRTVEVAFALEHTQAWKDSVAQASAKARKGRQWARRIVFGVLGAACAGVGVAMNADAKDHYDAATAALADYGAARSGFDEYKSTFDAEVDEGNSAATVRNVFYVAGGVFGAAMVISIPF